MQDNGFWGPMFYDGGIADIDDSPPKETFFHAAMEQYASLVLPSVEVLACTSVHAIISYFRAKTASRWKCADYNQQISHGRDRFGFHF